MSQRDVHGLDNKFAYLRLSNDLQESTKTKKIPPAVPPKKKTQPQVSTGDVMRIQEVMNNVYLRPESANRSTLSEYTYQNNVNGFRRKNKGDQYNMSSETEYPTFTRSPNYNSEGGMSTPPPPPPLPFNYSSHNTSVIGEQYIPPQSPVSSNYSELARATMNMREKSNHYPTYQNVIPEHYGKPLNSTYESLYETIDPHPSEPVSGLNNNIEKFCMLMTDEPSKKEEEVDTLTNLLVKSMTDNQEPDFFGMCFKCNEKVIGDNSGCTAMGNLYHVKCFRCNTCDSNLHGIRFYAVEGKPYCEIDYLETLEKCTVCNKPITDRILRATGNPYHGRCFTCIVCGQSLDGIPFTVDALNRIHCIEDFHKKFAPRCSVCELPIVPEDGEEETVRVVALDRSFHVHCYRCEDCGILLSSGAEGKGCYPLDDQILCKNCNAHRIRQLTNVITTDL